MTRQHFEQMAAIVRSILNGEWTNEAPAWCKDVRYGRIMYAPDEEDATYTRAVQTAEAFIHLASSVNPRFDRARFLRACGLVE